MDTTIKKRRKCGRRPGPGRRLVGLFLPPIVHRSAMEHVKNAGYRSLADFCRRAVLERLKFEGWREPVAHPQEDLPGF
jgi:hypothetical protein